MCHLFIIGISFIFRYKAPASFLVLLNLFYQVSRYPDTLEVIKNVPMGNLLYPVFSICHELYSLYTPKNVTSVRSIPLMPEVIELLKRHRKSQKEKKLIAGSAYKDNDMIFCNEIGEYIIPNKFNKKHDQILKQNNIRHVKFHGLRYAFATRSLENGISMKVVQTVLGHSKMETTANIYSHVSVDEIRKALEKNRQKFSG